jgi:hypothetical protein
MHTLRKHAKALVISRIFCFELIDVVCHKCDWQKRLFFAQKY